MNAARGTPTIQGEGIVLRVLQPADRERWLELCHDPAQLRFGSPAFVLLPETVADLDERMRESSERFAARQPGSLAAVEVEDPGRMLGILGWRHDSPPAMGVGDIGYTVHPDARGRGVASRAVRTFTRWLTVDEDGPSLARLQLDHSVENAPSCRVALAAGFEREGVRRSFLPLRDAEAPGGVRRHDVCLHGYLPGPTA